LNAGSTTRRRQRPWHLWIVALAVLALYIGGARDYLLILVQDTGYIRDQFGPGGVVYFTDYPPVPRIFWTINIVGGLIAPVLLLLRHRWTTLAAIVAAAGQIALLTITFAFFDRWAKLGASASLFDIGVGIATVLFACYCWWVSRRGLTATAEATRTG